MAGPQTLESIKRIEPVRHVFSQSFTLGSEGMVTSSERELPPSLPLCSLTFA